MGLREDLLDACGASDDHIESLVANIALISKRVNFGHAHQHLALEIRHGCAYTLQKLLAGMSASETSWFHAMALLDLYCHSGGNVDLQAIPTLCKAISIIVGKLDGANLDAVRRLVKSDEKMLEVYNKERDILETLEFRCQCPTITSWLNIFIPRLRSTIADPQLYVLFSRLIAYYVQQFVIQNPCLPDWRLRHIAQGLIGMAIVGVARMIGAALTQLRELPEGLRVGLLGCLGVDMATLEEDFNMVSEQLYLLPHVARQRDMSVISI